MHIRRIQDFLSTVRESKGYIDEAYGATDTEKNQENISWERSHLLAGRIGHSRTGLIRPRGRIVGRLVSSLEGLGAHEALLLLCVELVTRDLGLPPAGTD